MHFQNPPFAQSKLIQVTRGSIIDIILDIRKNSITYGKYLKFKISSDSFKQLYIPEGFAHGFCTLMKNTEVFYKVSNYYSPENEQTIFENIETPMIAGRYHSLSANEEHLPEELSVSAKTESGEIMAVRHLVYKTEGVQFHPESIMTSEGMRLMENFLNIKTRGRHES